MVTWDTVPDGSSTAGLEVGETLSLENLLYCLMVVSGNEAANILAETVSGNVESFVARMNSKAQALGCEDTHFVNPNGLHDEDHYTSAWDLYLITKAAMEYEDFMTFADAPYFTLPATEFHSERTLYTTNLLLSPYRGAGYVYPDAAGVKTGSTTPAGNCLVSTASRDGRSLLGVILGAERVELEDGSTQVQSFSEMARMFDWGFDQFSRQVIISADELIAEREGSLSEITHVVVHPAYEVERLLPNDVAPEDLERTYTYTADVVEAPVTKGDVLGEVGGVPLRGNGEPLGGALVPVIEGAVPHQIVADNPRVEDQTGVGPAAVCPDLHRDGGALLPPEGLNGQLAVVAVGANQGFFDDVLHRLRGNGDGLIGVGGRLGSGGYVAPTAGAPAAGKFHRRGVEHKQTPAKAGEHGADNEHRHSDGNEKTVFRVHGHTSQSDAKTLAGQTPEKGSGGRDRRPKCHSMASAMRRQACPSP